MIQRRSSGVPETHPGGDPPTLVVRHDTLPTAGCGGGRERWYIAGMIDETPRPRRRPSGSPVGEALVWVSRITVIGLSMFVPGLVGGWLDARLGLAVLGPLGFVVGFVAGLAQLSAIARRP